MKRVVLFLATDLAIVLRTRQPDLANGRLRHLRRHGGGLKRLFASHPGLDERIAALRGGSG